MLACPSEHVASPRAWAKLLTGQQTLPLLQIKVVQKRNGREQPMAGEPAWCTSRCRSAGVFLSWNLAVTRQPRAEQTPCLAWGLMLSFPQLQWRSRWWLSRAGHVAGFVPSCAGLCQTQSPSARIPWLRPDLVWIQQKAASQKHGRAVAQPTAHEYAWACCQDCLLPSTETPQKYPEVFFASHTRVRQDLSNWAQSRNIKGCRCSVAERSKHVRAIVVWEWGKGTIWKIPKNSKAMRRKARSGAALHSQEKLSGGDNPFAGSRELDALEDPWSGTAKIAH